MCPFILTTSDEHRQNHSRVLLVIMHGEKKFSPDQDSSSLMTLKFSSGKSPVMPIL